MSEVAVRSSSLTHAHIAIVFAWRLGAALEPEAKRYRLLADFFNDASIILDAFSPYFILSPAKHIAVLCTSGALRALCGVAAGGAKAALSVHFAKSGNIGDLNAKDSSQETVIGLLGMLVRFFFKKEAIMNQMRPSRLGRDLRREIHLNTQIDLVRSSGIASCPPFYQLFGCALGGHEYSKSPAGVSRIHNVPPARGSSLAFGGLL